jgi:hypothetical protein
MINNLLSFKKILLILLGFFVLSSVDIDKTYNNVKSSANENLEINTSFDEIKSDRGFYHFLQLIRFT